MYMQKMLPIKPKGYFPELLPLKLCFVTIVYRMRWLLCVLMIINFIFFCKSPVKLQIENVYYLGLSAMVIIYLFRYQSGDRQHRFFQWPNDLQPVLLHDKLLYLSKVIEHTRNPSAINGQNVATFLAKLQDDLGKVTAESDKLVLMLSETTQTTDFFIKGLLEARTSQTALIQQLYIAQEQNATANRELQDLNPALVRLSSELKQQEHCYNEAKEKTRSTEQRIERLMDDIAARSAETQRLKEDYSFKQDEIIKKDRELTRCREQNVRTNRELEDLNPTLARLSLELQQQERSYIKAKEKRRSTEQKVEQLQDAIALWSAKTQSLKEEVRDKKREIELKVHELQAKVDELEHLQGQNFAVEAEIVQAKDELKGKEAILKDLEEEVLVNIKEKAEMRRKIKEQGEIIELMQEEVEAVRQGVEEAVEKYKALCTRENQLLQEGMTLTHPNKMTQTDKSSELGGCCMCMERDIDCVLIPCGHMCSCQGCAANLRRAWASVCPICRKDIEMVQKCYTS